MAGESISIPILTPGADAAARNIKQVGNASAETAGKLDVAAASLAAWNAAALKSAKADSTLVQSKKAHAKADALLADAERVLAGEATKNTKLFADQGRNLSGVEKAAGDASKGLDLVSNSAGLTTSGMGALIGAGVALSPVIATVGVGLGGLALAALAAGKNSKQLKAELDPLKDDFAAFGKQLQPVVLYDFAKAAGVARTVLHALEPVTEATGKALGDTLGRIDAMFQSGRWQAFFAWMASQAGPDLKLLTDSFINLANTLPGLLKALNPVSQELLQDVSIITSLVQKLSELGDNTTASGKAAAAAAKSHNIFGDALKNAVHFLAPEVPLSQQLHNWLLKLGDSSQGAGKGLEAAALGAVHAHAPFFDLNKAVAALNTSMTTLVGNLLTLQGDNVAWRQSMEAAKKQLDSNKAGLEGNSKAALANKQAVISSTNAAISFADHQITLGKNIDGASRTVQAQIKWLEGLHSKSSLVKDEIEALRKEEQKLNEQRIRQTIQVQGLGQWSVSQSLAPGAGHRRAAGGMIPGSGNSDNYPALLTPGEVVVPKGMVSAGAVDHLRGRLPGFASGGLVPSYSGAVGGVWPWIKMNDTATIRLMDEAIARATVAGMRAAQSAASFGGGSGGPASGTVRALQQYAASLFGQYGWSVPVQLPPLIALWNGESGWNPNARNPISGAYGIPQALPPGKMGAAAASGNAAAQIRWGEGYIAGVYGTPAEAYGMWLSRSPHWYDKGGYLPTGLSLAYNGTGRPEMVVPHGRGGGGATVVNNVTVQVGHGTHPVAAAQELIKLLNAGAKSGVKLRTSILGPG